MESTASSSSSLTDIRSSSVIHDIARISSSADGRQVVVQTSTTIRAPAAQIAAYLMNYYCSRTASLTSDDSEENKVLERAYVRELIWTAAA
jgi:hypothetical protein